MSYFDHTRPSVRAETIVCSISPLVLSAIRFHILTLDTLVTAIHIYLVLFLMSKPRRKHNVSKDVRHYNLTACILHITYLYIIHVNSFVSLKDTVECMICNILPDSLCTHLSMPNLQSLQVPCLK